MENDWTLPVYVSSFRDSQLSTSSGTSYSLRLKQAHNQTNRPSSDTATLIRHGNLHQHISLKRNTHQMLKVSIQARRYVAVIIILLIHYWHYSSYLLFKEFVPRTLILQKVYSPGSSGLFGFDKLLL